MDRERDRMPRRWILGCLIGLAAAVAAAAGDPYAWAAGQRLIAHALGGIGGHTYTNCREAFLTNYAKGFRLFETDLSPTSDGQRACVHDWSYNLLHTYMGIDIPAGQENQPLTLADWRSKKIYGTYTPMGFADAARLLRDYPDAWLVLDTKISNGAEIAATFSNIKNVANYVDPSVLNRILPEIYNQPMYDTVMAIYPFKACLYTMLGNPDTPAQFLAFMQKKGIGAASIWYADANATFLNNLKNAGIYTYIWGDPYPVDDIFATRTLINEGAWGFYTNFLLPYQVNPSASQFWRKYE